MTYFPILRLLKYFWALKSIWATERKDKNMARLCSSAQSGQGSTEDTAVKCEKCYKITVYKVLWGQRGEVRSCSRETRAHCTQGWFWQGRLQLLTLSNRCTGAHVSRHGAWHFWGVHQCLSHSTWKLLLSPYNDDISTQVGLSGLPEVTQLVRGAVWIKMCLLLTSILISSLNTIKKSIFKQKSFS